VWKIYQQIASDRSALQAAHAQLLHLNQNLESMVRERTRALAVSEQQYRRIFEVSRDMILVVDARGAITDVNPAGAQMLGYDGPGETPVGEPFKRFFEQEADWEAQASIWSTGSC
jgi:PAS domain-containing protein